jgi:hypothetical protein
MSEDSTVGPEEPRELDDEPTVLSARPQFAPIPEALLLDSRVSGDAVRLWGLLDRTASRDRIFPGRTRLAKQLGVSVATLDRKIAELSDAGWLHVKRRGQGRTNVYTLLDRPDSPPMMTLESSPVRTLDSSPVTRKREEEEREEDEVGAGSAEDTPVAEFGSEIVDLCEHLADRIEAHRGKRPKVTTKWLKDMQLLVRRGDPTWARPEGVPPAKIRALVDFTFDNCEKSQSGFCWADQVQAPGGLRAKWEKIRHWANQTHAEKLRSNAAQSGEGWMNRSSGSA